MRREGTGIVGGKILWDLREFCDLLKVPIQQISQSGHETILSFIVKEFPKKKKRLDKSPSNSPQARGTNCGMLRGFSVAVFARARATAGRTRGQHKSIAAMAASFVKDPATHSNYDEISTTHVCGFFRVIAISLADVASGSL